MKKGKWYNPDDFVVLKKIELESGHLIIEKDHTMTNLLKRSKAVI